MRKLVSLALILALASPAVAHAEKVRDPGRYCRTSEGNGWSNKDVGQAIRCAADRWHVSGGPSKALSVARCESGLNEHSRNACCSGVFQQHRAYWRSRRRHFDPHHGWKLKNGVENARVNVVVSIRMAHAGGWGDWSCA